MHDYSKKKYFHPQNLSQELLLRKRRLCEEFLEVYTKIDPGSSDWRGSTLFEVAMTRAELAQRYRVTIQLVQNLPLTLI